MKCCGCLLRDRSNLSDPEDHEDREEKQDVHTVLLECLDNLWEDELERFHFYLNNELPEEYKSIPKSHLEGQSRTNTVDRMLKRYGRKHAWRVTVHILRKMDLNEQAESLQTRIDRGVAREETDGQELHRGGQGPLQTTPAPVGPPPVVTTEKQNPPFSAGLTPVVTIDRQPNPEPILNGADETLRAVQRKLRANLKTRYERIFEGVAKQGRQALLAKVFTEVFITEGGCGNVNKEHEVWCIEAEHKKPLTDEVRIECNRIFQPLPGEDICVRSVLTKGIAGIGKTVSVQKFILDWAEGKANEDIDLILPLPFRELNLMKAKEFSLLELIQHYHPELKDCKMSDLNCHKVVFIFDGLDECRFPLDFDNNEPWYEVTQPLSVDVLLTNLIKGHLLPSALLWITSRPAAANQIPPECIYRVTEVRGFDDPKKEEYFRKRFSDQTLASRIITHIMSSRSLFIMCHIPIFCWISATVLERLMEKSEGGEIPKTLTEMYTHFLLIQMAINNKKLQRCNEKDIKTIRKSEEKIIVNLGHLAFHHLEKDSLIFYEEDLRQSGINVKDISEYSSLCTEELGLCEEKTYCFVHLTIQEYLAAFYAFHSCTELNKTVFHPEHKQSEDESSSDEEDHSENDVDGEDDYVADELRSTPLSQLHRSAVDKALQSQRGHLDLFLRFLLGISLDSNKSLLRKLLPKTGSNPQSIKVIVRYIKEKIRKNMSPERTINLFHCLNELNDHSAVEEIHGYLNSNRLSDQKLSPSQCSALAYVQLMREKAVDNLDLSMYNTTTAGRQRLLPVVMYCKRARLHHCNITAESCETVISALQSPNSHLRDLDLGYNELGDSGLNQLCTQLHKPHCKLQSLRLECCNLTQISCELLASVISSDAVNLRGLDLSCNDLGDEGVKRLFTRVQGQHCKLEMLGLRECNLTAVCCSDLVTALCSELRELELRDNDLLDSGVEALCAGLRERSCKLQKLGLSGCGVTERGCASLASALKSNPSHLRELDLSYNHPGESGVRTLSAGLEDPNYKLEKLIVDHIGECRNKLGMRKYDCQLTLDPNTVSSELCLSEGGRKVTRWAKEQSYPQHDDRFDWPQVLCREGLSEGRHYWEAEWSGREVQVGVAYKDITRKGMGNDSVLGWNQKSWSLSCTDHGYVAWHGNRRIILHPHRLYSHRLGVYLDWQAGALSFYSVSSSSEVTHLHTFHATFTGPLYPGVWLMEPDDSFHFA